MTIYYQDEHVTLYHGDCLEIMRALPDASVDSVVTDPPYGIAWDRPETAGARSSWYNPGIKGDSSTAARDAVLDTWGTDKPALVFGSLRAEYPEGWRQMLVFRKPKATASGMFGAFLPWRKDWEPIFVLGKEWPREPSIRSAIVETNALSAGGHTGYATKTGHPHTKPLDVMEQLIAATPGATVADPFAGSGSTLVAAKALGRKAIGVELEERYCEIAAKRLSQGVLDFGEAS